MGAPHPPTDSPPRDQPAPLQEHARAPRSIGIWLWSLFTATAALGQSAYAGALLWEGRPPWLAFAWATGWLGLFYLSIRDVDAYTRRRWMRAVPAAACLLAVGLGFALHDGDRHLLAVSTRDARPEHIDGKWIRTIQAATKTLFPLPGGGVAVYAEGYTNRVDCFDAEGSFLHSVDSDPEPGWKLLAAGDHRGPVIVHSDRKGASIRLPRDDAWQALLAPSPEGAKQERDWDAYLDSGPVIPLTQRPLYPLSALRLPTGDVILTGYTHDAGRSDPSSRKPFVMRIDVDGTERWRHYFEKGMPTAHHVTDSEVWVRGKLDDVRGIGALGLQDGEPTWWQPDPDSHYGPSLWVDGSLWQADGHHSGSAFLARSVRDAPIEPLARSTSSDRFSVSRPGAMLRHEDDVLIAASASHAWRPDDDHADLSSLWLTRFAPDGTFLWSEEVVRVWPSQGASAERLGVRDLIPGPNGDVYALAEGWLCDRPTFGPWVSNPDSNRGCANMGFVARFTVLTNDR